MQPCLCYTACMPPWTSHGTLPDFIRALRLELGEDHATFGQRFDSSGRTVQEWEKGARTPRPLVQRLLRAEKARLEAESAQQPA